MARLLYRKWEIIFLYRAEYIGLYLIYQKILEILSKIVKEEKTNIYNRDILDLSVDISKILEKITNRIIDGKYQRCQIGRTLESLV